jgi:phenylacetate-CoA ligase
LILCGTNLTEGMLDETVKSTDLAEVLTGVYRARIVYEDGRQRLALTLEFRAAPIASGMLDDVYEKLVAGLGKVQPEFQEDWQNVYRAWDEDRQHRILKIEPVQWPGLSDAVAIKQRGIEA